MSQTACVYNFGEVFHRDNWNFKIPGSVFWRIYHVTDGSAKVRIYNKVQELRPGYFYMIPAFVAHEDILHGSFLHRYLHFRLDDTYLSDMMDGYDLAFEIPASPLLVDIFDRISVLCEGFELETPLPQDYENKSSYLFWSHRYDNLPIAVRMELGGYIKVVLSIFLQNSVMHKPASNPRVNKGKVFIDKKFGEPIMIEDVACHVGMRPESFIRAYRHEYNRTPYSYLMEKRINRAKNLLLLSTKSIKEITHDCGFRDQSHFCMVFKKATSTTPGMFRCSIS